MDINEHWRAAETYAEIATEWAAGLDGKPTGYLANLGEVERSELRLTIALADMHYRAASAAALFAQHRAAAGDVIDAPTGWVDGVWSEDTVRRLHGMVTRRVPIEMFGVWYAPAALDGEGQPTRYVADRPTEDLTEKAARAAAAGYFLTADMRRALVTVLDLWTDAAPAAAADRERTAHEWPRLGAALDALARITGRAR